MKNPLNKRLPRELAKDATKYIAIFIMMVLLISICSGMRVGNESLKKAYYDSFELYNIEDGHVTFDKPLPEELRNTFESNIDLTFYDNMYFDEKTAETGADIRVFKQSDAVNTPCLLSGSLPAQDDEIAIDRVFAKNNGIKVGDTVTLKGKALKITGFIALPDYSTLFESNTDSMFDSINFSVAVMTDGGFETIESKNLKYNYAWQYNTPYADDTEAAERSEKFTDLLSDELTDYDEAIVQVQIDALTDKLEKASEEYADIYKASFEKKVDEITAAAETGAEEYGELYKAAIEKKLTEVSESISKGAEEYAALYMATGEKPSAADLSVQTDDFTFGIIENSVNAMLTGSEYSAPDEQEFVERYIDTVEKPKKSDLSVETDDFLFGIIEKSVDAAVKNEEYDGPTEEEFKDQYLDSVEKPSKEELSTELDDFLFGIIEDAVSAEINGEEYTMPEDEAFEDEIDQSDIITVDDYVPRYLNQAVNFANGNVLYDDSYYRIYFCCHYFKYHCQRIGSYRYAPCVRLHKGRAYQALYDTSRNSNSCGRRCRKYHRLHCNEGLLRWSLLRLVFAYHLYNSMGSVRIGTFNSCAYPAHACDKSYGAYFKAQAQAPEIPAS